MSWNRPPSADMPAPGEVTRTVRQVLERGARDALSLLEAGSPVHTGQFQAAWDVLPTEAGFVVLNSAPHAPYVDIDDRPVAAHAAAIDQHISRAVDAQFRR